MNIQVTQINNGFVVAIQAQTNKGPQQSATYVLDFAGVLKELQELGSIISPNSGTIPESPKDS